ncbi:MAG: RNA methyltransferase [Terracidiphilus sp.]
MLTKDQRDRFEIVLVSPRNPLNTGAAARAMANFGFSHLSVVAPFEAHWREAQSAIGAEELLQNARTTESLEEAIADCTLVIGTGTLTHRKAEQTVVPLSELGSRVGSELDRGGRIALVFGSEKRGLTRDDLSYCHLLAVIPTDAAQPSMNLGQAVAVCLYELAGRSGAFLSRKDKDAARMGRPEISGESTAQVESPTATSGELDRLAGMIEEAMLAAGYSPREMQAANRHDLRLLLLRLNINGAGTRRALGLFRRILHKIGN